MIPLKSLIEISKVKGVDQYMFVDPRGNSIAQDIKAPETAARIIFSCGQNSSSLGNTKFKLLVFTRKNQKDFFIFPIGNYYLGVIKSQDIDVASLVGNIGHFLNGLLKKRPHE